VIRARRALARRATRDAQAQVAPRARRPPAPPDVRAELLALLVAQVEAEAARILGD